MLLLIAVPILAACISVGLGSLIYRATHWDRDMVISGVLGVTVVFLLTLVRVFQRRSPERRRSRDESSS
jgi:membrane-associated phospholipid phosphatase